MPMINIEILGEPRPELAKGVAETVQANAAEFLHADAELLTIRVAFSSANDIWFSNAKVIDGIVSPTFFALAFLPKDLATQSEVGSFIVETRDKLKIQMAAAYPGTVYPDIPDRNKVVVATMP